MEVATELNKLKLFPWLTDGKHCQDRFKLLIKNWRSEDARMIKASGVDETYGELEQLCEDIREQMDDTAVAKSRVRNAEDDKKQKLTEAGEEIRLRSLKRKAERK